VAEMVTKICYLRQETAIEVAPQWADEIRFKLNVISITKVSTFPICMLRSGFIPLFVKSINCSNCRTYEMCTYSCVGWQ